MLWNFVLSNTQMTDNIFTNNFIYFVWNSIVRISFDAIFCLVMFVTFWCNAWGTFVTFLIKIMCSLMHGQKSFTIFVLEILLKYQVTNWWLKNLLMWSNKEADFFPEINKSFTFPGMGQQGLEGIYVVIFKGIFYLPTSICCSSSTNTQLSHDFA